MTPEQSYLCNFLRGNRLRMPDSCDADILLSLLRRHKLLPVAEDMLDLIPETHRARWKQFLQRWAVRASFIADEAFRVNELLGNKNIPVLYLKGPILARQIFGNYHGRFFVDVDLLVDPELVRTVLEILTAQGYTMRDPAHGMDNPALEEHLQYNNDVVLQHDHKQLLLELHLGIYVKGILDKRKEKLLLNDQQSMAINGHVIKILSNESQLLYLCFHAAKHMFFRLSWLRDIKWCVERLEMNHGRVLSLAEQTGLERSLCLALQLTAHYFDFSVPAVYSGWKKYRRNRLLLMLARRIISGPGLLTYNEFRRLSKKKDAVEGVDRVRPGDMLNQLIYLVLLRKGVRNKAAFLLYQFRKRIL